MDRSAKNQLILPKVPTGIEGLDVITGGGLPKGRPTLVCGSAGCGKTLLAMEFLVRGASQFGEPGVFMAFEETEPELVQNVASLGFDLPHMIRNKKLLVDYVRVEPQEIRETGEYDLEGLFVRLGYAIDSIHARRVVLDTIEVLFGGLSNEALLRAELRRLFRWLKDRGVTAIITGERGENTLTRYGLEEYVADCVIQLDHRITNQISTRRLRIVKYRGAFHQTNEYPFLISQTGISVLPITGLGLDHPAPRQRVSTGVPRLDGMLAGNGFYRGSTVLISGTAGTGKTSLASAFVRAACQRGERSLYLAFEESPEQIKRNMASIGIHLAPCERRGLLKIHAARPHLCGLEMHLLSIHDQIREFAPRNLVVDPITNLIATGDESQVRSMLVRLIDFLKSHSITAVFTSLTDPTAPVDQSEVGISSLIDTWIGLRNIEYAGERNRALHVLKSRGMAHSNQVREFVLSRRGLQLLDVYIGGGEVLTGTARMAQEAQQQVEAERRVQELGRLRRMLERKRRAAEAQAAALAADTQGELEELNLKIRQAQQGIEALAQQREAIGRRRTAELVRPQLGQPAPRPHQKLSQKTALRNNSR
jgi:circadian clock protein KaiC